MKKYEVKIHNDFFGEFRGWVETDDINKSVSEMVDNWAYELDTIPEEIEVFYVKEIKTTLDN